MLVTASLIAVSAGVLTGNGASAATVDTNATYVLVAAHSGKAISVANGSTADGAGIVQNTRNDGTAQQWRFVDSGGGFYRLRSALSNKVIDVSGRSTSDGANIIQWADANTTNQQFRLVDSDPTHVRLINRNSNKALDVWEWSTADGARISQFTDLNGANQQFQLIRLGAPGDTQPPTVPGNVRVTGVTSSSVTLAWNASTDNVAVTGYEIFQGATLANTVAGTSSTVTGLSANTAYTFTVRARDAAGNRSAASTSVTATTSGSGGGTTPVGINGQLRVCGVNLCNQHGNPIQLRGMSTHGLQWFSQCIKNASLDALATDWNADVLRLAMYVQEGGYETDPRRFTDLVHQFIDMVSARGMYVIVDFHTLTPGDPNFNLSRARTFFGEIAARHANKPNIIYEIANEPNGVSWAGIKSYAEQIIPVIRAADPDGVVIVGTRAWSSLGVSEGANENEVINNPVNAPNIMYAFHFYAASHMNTYRSTVSRTASRLPLFVTEFGTVSSTGGGANDFTSSQQWIDLLNSLKISWAIWTFSDSSETSAAFNPGTCAGTSFTGTGVLKPSGAWVRDRIRTPDNFPTN
ncbi:cellulase family glycosylhydrolase [Rhizocola hellebori]|nr:cellulase family glycosylhydrolase [Rhizocola hellebori]